MWPRSPAPGTGRSPPVSARDRAGAVMYSAGRQGNTARMTPTCGAGGGQRGGCGRQEQRHPRPAHLRRRRRHRFPALRPRDGSGRWPRRMPWRAGARLQALQPIGIYTSPVSYCGKLEADLTSSRSFRVGLPLPRASARTDHRDSYGFFKLIVHSSPVNPGRARLRHQPHRTGDIGQRSCFRRARRLPLDPCDYPTLRASRCPPWTWRQASAVARFTTR